MWVNIVEQRQCEIRQGGEFDFVGKTKQCSYRSFHLGLLKYCFEETQQAVSQWKTTGQRDSEICRKKRYIQYLEMRKEDEKYRAKELKALKAY